MFTTNAEVLSEHSCDDTKQDAVGGVRNRFGIDEKYIESFVGGCKIYCVGLGQE